MRDPPETGRLAVFGGFVGSEQEIAAIRQVVDPKEAAMGHVHGQISERAAGQVVFEGITVGLPDEGQLAAVR